MADPAEPAYRTDWTVSQKELQKLVYSSGLELPCRMQRWTSAALAGGKGSIHANRDK